MSDFPSSEADIFGGNFSSGIDASGDDLDFERAASAFPDISLDGTGDFDVPTPAPPAAARGNSGFSFDDFGSPPRETQSTIKVTGDDELDRFESDFPDIDVGKNLSPPQSSYGSTFAPRPQPSAFSSTPMLHQQAPEDEPQVIKDWREKQQVEIKARDEASKVRRQETISKAEQAIDEFYENYAQKKKQNIGDNKDQEAEVLAKLSNSLASGTTWERICDFVELQNSQSKTIARTGSGTTDLTRFKEVLLRLRREGDAAPGAAGY